MEIRRIERLPIPTRVAGNTIDKKIEKVNPINKTNNNRDPNTEQQEKGQKPKEPGIGENLDIKI